MIYNNNYYIKPFRKNIKINIIRMLSIKIMRGELIEKKYKDVNKNKLNKGNFYMVDRNESIYTDKYIKDDVEKSYIFLKMKK